MRIVENGWLLLSDFVLRTAWRDHLQRLRPLRRRSMPMVGTRRQLTVRHLVTMAFLEQWVLLLGYLLVLYEGWGDFVVPGSFLLLTLALEHLLLGLSQELQLVADFLLLVREIIRLARRAILASLFRRNYAAIVRVFVLVLFLVDPLRVVIE